MLLLISIAIAIFLLTALFGRVWCGWACPQTVYMEFLFRPLERLARGRPARLAGARQAAAASHPRRLLKYARLRRAGAVPGAHLPRLLRRRRRSWSSGCGARRSSTRPRSSSWPGTTALDLLRLRLVPRADLPGGLPLRPAAVGAARPAVADRRLRRRAAASRARQGLKDRPGTARRLHRLRRLRAHLPDRHRHPRRPADGVHPLHPVHRRLRRRHGQGRQAARAHPLHLARRASRASRPACCARASCSTPPRSPSPSGCSPVDLGTRPTPTSRCCAAPARRTPVEPDGSVVNQVRVKITNRGRASRALPHRAGRRRRRRADRAGESARRCRPARPRDDQRVRRGAGGGVRRTTGSPPPSRSATAPRFTLAVPFELVGPERDARPRRRRGARTDERRPVVAGRRSSPCSAVTVVANVALLLEGQPRPRRSRSSPTTTSGRSSGTPPWRSGRRSAALGWRLDGPARRRPSRASATLAGATRATRDGAPLDAADVRADGESQRARRRRVSGARSLATRAGALRGAASRSDARGLWELRSRRGARRRRVRRAGHASDNGAPAAPMNALVLSVLGASLLGSPHCAAMCGGFVCFFSGQGGARPSATTHAAYHGGRLAGLRAARAWPRDWPAPGSTWRAGWPASSARPRSRRASC